MFARRALNGSASNGTVAPAPRWTRTVAADEASVSAKNGTFSSSRRRRVGTWELKVKSLTRCNGQKSSNNKTHGHVTSIGLLSKPSAKKVSAAAYQSQPLILNASFLILS